MTECLADVIGRRLPLSKYPRPNQRPILDTGIRGRQLQIAIAQICGETLGTRDQRLGELSRWDNENQ